MTYIHASFHFVVLTVHLLQYIEHCSNNCTFCTCGYAWNIPSSSSSSSTTSMLSSSFLCFVSRGSLGSFCLEDTPQVPICCVCVCVCVCVCLCVWLCVRVCVLPAKCNEMGYIFQSIVFKHHSRTTHTHWTCTEIFNHCYFFLYLHSLPLCRCLSFSLCLSSLCLLSPLDPTKT